MATNVVTLLTIARSTTGSDFGRFAVQYGLIVFSIGVLRSVTTDVAAARFGGQRRELSVIGPLLAKTAGLPLVVLAVAYGLAGVVVFGGVDRLGVVVAMCGVAVVVHELVRAFALAALAPGVAVEADAAWAVVVAAGLVLNVVVMTGDDRAIAALVAWGLGACVGAVAGAVRLGALGLTRPSGDDAAVGSIAQAWRAERRTAAPAYAFEFVLSRGIPEVVGLTLAAVVSFEATGSYRLAITLLGPIGVIVGGTRSILAAELRARIDVVESARRLALGAAVVLVLVPVIYGGVLLATPESWRTSVMGPLAAGIQPYVLYLVARRSATTASLPPFLLLRTLGRAGQTSRIRSVEAAATFSALAVCAFAAGENGILIGLPVVAWCAVVVWWRTALSASQPGEQAGHLEPSSE